MTIKQVNVAVPAGVPVSLEVEITPVAGQSTAVVLRVSVNGKQLIDLTAKPTWTPGPAVGMRSWAEPVTYSQLKVVPAAAAWTECPGISHVKNGDCNYPTRPCRAGSGATNILKTSTLVSKPHSYLILTTPHIILIILT